VRERMSARVKESTRERVKRVRGRARERELE
jgi:hypothetical protein